MAYVFSWPAGTLTDREFRAGDLALLINNDPGVYEVVEITAVTDSSITVAQEPQRQWPVGSRLIPLRKAHFDQLPARSLPTSHVATMTARFELDGPVTDIVGDWGALGQMLGFKTNWAANVDLGYDRIVYQLDMETGVTEILDPIDAGRVSMRSAISLFGRDAVTSFRKFIAKARGRAVSFWCATGSHDLEPIGTIGGSITLDVAAVGNSELFDVPQDARSAIAIYRKNEPIPLCRRILDISGRAGFDRLTLNAEIPSMLRSSIDRISYLMPARFDQDAFEIEHVTDNLRAVRSAVSVRSIGTGALDIELAAGGTSGGGGSPVRPTEMTVIFTYEVYVSSRSADYFYPPVGGNVADVEISVLGTTVYDLPGYDAAVTSPASPQSWNYVVHSTRALEGVSDNDIIAEVTGFSPGAGFVETGGPAYFNSDTTPTDGMIIDYAGTQGTGTVTATLVSATPYGITLLQVPPHFLDSAGAVLTFNFTLAP